MNSDARHAGAERRQSERFTIERHVRYRVLTKRSTEETGEGPDTQYLKSWCFVQAHTAVVDGLAPGDVR